MSTELPKTYDPSAVEPEANRVWTDEKLFHAEPTNPGKPYSIVIPPPNVTAALHLGHALNNTLQDILIRAHRMMGDNTCWFPGTDHAGIATQTVVEKRVMAEEGKRRTEFSRDEFVRKIQAWKDEYEARITEQLQRMGCSCDWDRQAFTMDDIRARAVREAFFRLFKDGLIYRGKRLVNWDPITQTALADDEVEMEEVDGHFYYLRYPLVDDAPEGIHRAASVSERSVHDTEKRSLTVAARASFVTVATTRPETMLGDTAVAINPKDPRAAHLRGKSVRLPIVNREIPIIEDDYVVLPVSMGGDENDPKAQFATGFLKVTPAHDPNDYEIGQRHKLPMINVMAPDATISDKHGWTDVGDATFLLDKDRLEARQLVVKWFKDHGLLEEIKPYKHTVGHSYRSHVPIEPYLSDQWYCKVTDERLAGAALRAMAADQYEDFRKPTTSRDREGADPIAFPAYFITFTCYGTWLHGDERSSADRSHNLPGTPYLSGDEEREKREFDSLKHPPMEFDEPHRHVVQQAVFDVCRHRGWNLLALNVRKKHVHCVVSAGDVSPEKVMNDFKAYATRHLREAKLTGPEARVWTRHGSTRYLNDVRSVEAACQYVVDEQGAALAPAAYDARQTSRERERAVSVTARTPLPYGRGSLRTHAELRFYPSRYARTFQSWHENIRDWCISRQLWWGHRIPVWRREMTEDQLKALFEEAHDFAALLQEGEDAAVIARVVTAKESYHVTGHRKHLECLGGAMEDSHDAPITWYLVPRDNSLQVAGKSIDLWLNEHGFEQDPDVLDTWFSSALWPLSTMHWPDQSAIGNRQSALNVWNPTSVLCTAREIITLWVSRMVMFNLYFLNRLPFLHVFIHAMIQDGHGQKMSKSLGNGVDPVDIIHSHGADAMRFTLASMATNTQDVRMPVDMVDPHSGETFAPKYVTDSAGHTVAAPVQESPKVPGKKMVSSYGVASGQAKPTPDMPQARNTSSKFDLGRNFCNKLWNAARFAMMNLSKLSDEATEQRSDEGEDSLVDRWIVSRFNRTVAEANEALAEYRFDQYARACYDFFWRDFCDWYLEAVKPAMRDPKRAAQTANVLAAVLDGSLRLMHPMIPFITETIYWRLNETRAERGLPGRIMGCTSNRLITAAWPRVGSFDESAEQLFPKIQEIIVAIRNVRNEYKVDAKKSVSVSILAPTELSEQIRSNREVIELLGTCVLKDIRPDLAPIADAARGAAVGCQIFVEGLLDHAAEQHRAGKRREELLKQIGNLKGRLSNQGYIAKAPPHLVQQTKDQLAEAEAELAELG